VTQYIALLRNIGPATHGRMPLRKLAEACAAGGLADVVNVGTTGNLVFASDETQAAVEAVVTSAVESFGVVSEVFTRTRRQLQMLLNLAPFPEAAADHPGRMAVSFFHKTPAWPATLSSYPGPERLLTFSNHLIVDYGDIGAGSKLMIEKRVGARMTERTWSTILRIAQALNL